MGTSAGTRRNEERNVRVGGARARRPRLCDGQEYAIRRLARASPGAVRGGCHGPAAAERMCRREQHRVGLVGEREQPGAPYVLGWLRQACTLAGFVSVRQRA